MTRERARALAEGTVEAAWLAAAVIALLLGLPYGELGLDSNRWLVLRPLAALALGAAAASALLGGGETGRAAARRFRLSPVRWAALGLAAALALATAVSIDPLRSLHGALPRMAGLLSLLAPLALLWVAAPRLGAPARRERLLTVLVATGGALAVWALAARAGLDPLRWRELDGARAAGPQANPVFLGAALAALAPLALARALVAAQRGARAQAFGAAALFVLELGAAVAAGARGPLLGLAVGLALGAAAAARIAGRRRLAVAAVGGLLLMALAVPLAAPGAEGAGAKLRRAFDPERGTVAQRLRLWEGVWDLLASRPALLWIGQGPETLGLTLPAHLPPETPGLFYRPDQFHDRAHNLLFDWTVSAGVPGAVAGFALVIVALGGALAEAGAAAGRARLRLALATAGAGVLLAGLALALGRPPLIGLALGVAPALAAYALVLLAPGAGAAGPLVGAWVPLAVAAGLAAGLIEGGFGLRTAATETIVALLAAGVAGAPSSLAAAAPTARRGSPGAAPPTPATVEAAGWADGFLVALVLATCAVSLWAPQQVAAARSPARIAAMLGLVAGAAALAARQPLRAARSGLALAAPYLALHGLALAAGAQPATLVRVYFGFLALLLALAGRRLAPATGSGGRAPAARLALALALVAAPAALAASFSLRRIEAGVALADGRAALDAGQPGAAVERLEPSARAAPELEEPALALARARGRQAMAAADAGARDAGLAAALAELDGVARRHPRSVLVDLEAGLLLARAAEASESVERRADRLLAAAERLERAARRDPTSAPIARARGLVLLDLERIDEAIASLERAVAAAPRSLEGRLLLAKALLAGGELDRARGEAAAALELDAGKARLLVLGAAAARPDDVGAQLDATLVLLLGGDRQAALATLDHARALAMPGDRPWVERVAAAFAASP